jgi:hypothetical protein
MKTEAGPAGTAQQGIDETGSLILVEAAETKQDATRSLRHDRPRICMHAARGFGDIAGEIFGGGDEALLLSRQCKHLQHWVVWRL